MLEITLELKDTILDTFKIDKDEITIGRNSINDITIDNLAVSDRHARIVRRGEEFELSDEGSQNGTAVNGSFIDRRVLRAGDLLLGAARSEVIPASDPLARAALQF